MKLTFKLYAGLARYLPAEAVENAVSIEVADSATPFDIMDQFQVPYAEAHLVLRNGLYIEPEDRDKPVLSDGDVLALWPPVAGG